MIDNGAFILTELTSLPYFYRTLPLVQRENIYIVDEPAQR